ncbi:MAG: aldo/keto reductase [Victivallales bacterium]|nr:aldo/keto reductase [Victivallales bacterium]
MATPSAPRRPLGRTDLTVSPIAMGCWAIVGDATWGAQKESDAIAAIHAALDCGVNFLDTAEGYGAGYSEQILAKALKGRRDQVVIGSKASPNHAGNFVDLTASCEASLKNLGTDYIDVYHLHWPNRTVPIEQILADFAKLQDQGKIRAFAVSNFGKGDLTELLEHGRCEVNQLPYSLLWRIVEKEIAPICLANDISITCYSPILQGLLTGKFSSPDDVPDGRSRTRHFSKDRPQARHDEAGAETETFAALAEVTTIAADLGKTMSQVALAWLMYQPGVASVLVGARSAAQMAENAAAMHLVLDAETLARLDAATAPLKGMFGTNPDMWQSGANSRYL